MSTHQHRFLITSILLMLIAVTACQPQAASQATPALSFSAVLKEITGKANIKQPGASDFSPASVGMELQLNGSIQPVTMAAPVSTLPAVPSSAWLQPRSSRLHPTSPAMEACPLK